MKKAIYYSAIITILFFMISNSLQAQSGGNCSNAIIITPSNSNQPANDNIAASERWYKFVATSENVRITITNPIATSSGHIDAIFVFGDSCNGTNLIVSNFSLFKVAKTLTTEARHLILGNTYYVKLSAPYFANPFSVNYCFQNISYSTSNTSCNINMWSQIDPIGMNGPVFALTVFNGELYAGGLFTDAGGVAVNNIARWNGTCWNTVGSGLTGNGSTLNYHVRCLTVYNNELYVGGRFDFAGGSPSQSVAKWNGSTWTSVGIPYSNTDVDALEVHNGDLYAGLVSLNLTPYVIKYIGGSSWSSLNGISSSSGSGLTGALLSFNIGAPLLYTGGIFDSPSKEILTWNGSGWSGLAGGFQYNSLNWYGVYSLEGYNGQVYAGGFFPTTNSGLLVNNIASWNGSNWSSLGSGTNGFVYALQSHNGDLYVGGDFTSAGSNVLNRIAKWDGSNWLPSTSGNGMNDAIYAFTEYNGELYAGGQFTATDGTSNVNYISKICTQAPPLPAITVATNPNPALICSGSSIQLIASCASCTNYLWSPGGATTSSVTVSPSVTTQYTVIGSNSSSGCPQIADATVYVNDCCTNPAYTTYDNYTVSSNTSFVGSPTIINNTFTIAPHVTVDFNGCDILLGQNAVIQLSDYSTLNINNSHLHACTNMWDGIYLTSHPLANVLVNYSYLNITESTIEDARNAVYVNKVAEFHIDRSTLNLNYVDVHAYSAEILGSNSSITNSTFSCSGALKPSIPTLPSTSTFVHLDFFDWWNMSIGNTSSQNNISKGQYGIRMDGGSSITSYNNVFDGLMEGIDATNSSTIHLQTTNTIRNCNYGCYAHNKCDLHVEDNNRFESCWVGVVTNSLTNMYVGASGVGNYFNNCRYSVLPIFTGKNIYIENNTINEPQAAGVLSLFNTGSIQVISHNYISKSANSFNNLIGIGLGSNLNSNLIFATIEDNTITNLGRGIYADNSSNLFIHINNITMPDNTFMGNPLYGMTINYCHGSDVRRNNIIGNDDVEFDLSSSGIHVLNSYQLFLVCNNVDKVYKGLNWDVSTLNCWMLGTKMTDCYNGVYLTNNNYGLGHQGYQNFLSSSLDYTFDNEWLGLSVNQTYSDHSNDNGFGFTDFLVKNSPSYIPTNNFVNPNFNPYQPCSSTLINNPPYFSDDICGHQAQRQASDDKELALKLANDSTPDDPDMEGTKWMTKDYLYSMLKENPDWLLTEPGLASAMAQLEQSSITDFDSLSKSILASIDSLLTLATSDPNINVDSLNLVRAAQLRALNNSIEVEKQTEYNMQVVNDIYLKTIGVGTIYFDEGELMLLRAIASQCPYKGGNTVFEARDMLMLIDSTLQDYSHACDGVALRKSKQNLIKQPMAGKLFPNPNNGKMQYDYELQQNMVGVFEIYDIAGRVLESFSLKAGRNMLNIDLTGFSSGTYFYKVLMNRAVVTADRIVINK